MQHDRMKYVRIGWHFFQSEIEGGDIDQQYISTHIHEANLFTKTIQ